VLEAIADRVSNFCIVELEIDGSRRALPAPVGLESLFNDIVDGVKSLIPLEFAAGLGNLLVQDAEQESAHVGPSLEAGGRFR